MQVTYEITQNDYYVFLKNLYFKKDFGNRLLLLLLLSLIIVISTRRFLLELSHVFNAIVEMVVVFCGFTIISYLISRVRVSKALKNMPKPASMTLTIQNEGISIDSNSSQYSCRWEEIKSADLVSGYLHVTVSRHEFFIVPIGFFSSARESNDFLKVLKKGILKGYQNGRQEKLHKLYLWGLLGFIPNVGAIAGAVLTVKGFMYRDVKLIVIGIACIGFTVLFQRLAPLAFIQ